MAAVGEPGDVADLDQQPGGAGGADAVQVHQRGPGGCHQLAQLLVRSLLAPVDPLQVGDQLRGDPATGLAGCVARTDLRQQALAWAAERSFFAPPGISSSSRWCSWETIRVWSSPSDRRRSTSTRSTASCSSLTTGRSPAIRVPTSATEWASVASVLRPWPVAKTRARAESFGGTSRTSSPAASSRIATWWPIPLQPSIAQTRSSSSGWIW